MGLHTGTPSRTAEGYFGLDIHLGARVAAAGWGGQVLLTRAIRDLVDGDLRDLGEHRVKDFAEPVWIYQLGHESFPPSKTLSNSNLPRPASSFVGRGREVAELATLLRDARLVTLTEADPEHAVQHLADELGSRLDRQARLPGAARDDRERQGQPEYGRANNRLRRPPDGDPDRQRILHRSRPHG
jgi:hypothetical protein